MNPANFSSREAMVLDAQHQAVRDYQDRLDREDALTPAVPGRSSLPSPPEACEAASAPGPSDNHEEGM